MANCNGGKLDASIRAYGESRGIYNYVKGALEKPESCGATMSKKTGYRWINTPEASIREERVIPIFNYNAVHGCPNISNIDQNYSIRLIALGEKGGQKVGSGFHRDQTVFAYDNGKKINGWLGDIKVGPNGKHLYFDGREVIVKGSHYDDENGKIVEEGTLQSGRPGIFPPGIIPILSSGVLTLAYEICNYSGINHVAMEQEIQRKNAQKRAETMEHLDLLDKNQKKLDEVKKRNEILGF
jgi:hypothetical protein